MEVNNFLAIVWLFITGYQLEAASRFIELEQPKQAWLRCVMAVPCLGVAIYFLFA